MEGYITLLAFVIGIPLIYYGGMQWYKPCFEQKCNKERKILATWQEYLMLILSEAALIRIWYVLGKASIFDMQFVLLYVILVAMSILCMTDYWETVVPNSILLILLMLFIIVVGLHAVRDMSVFYMALPSIILGFLFCALTFGLGYVISKGSMGAGDVKLSLIMGLYLTGEYVVATIVYGCLLSAVYSVVQLVRKRLNRKDEIPFVPFLYIGLIIKYFVG